MKKLLTALSIVCLIPGVVGIIMSLFINLYEHEKVIILICGILAMVFIIIADPGILKPKKDVENIKVSKDSIDRATGRKSTGNKER